LLRHPISSSILQVIILFPLNLGFKGATSEDQSLLRDWMGCWQVIMLLLPAVISPILLPERINNDNQEDAADEEADSYHAVP